MAIAWNHNIYYHRLVLRAMPGTCDRALDVGCGRGLLTAKLADRATTVIGIDRDKDTLQHACAQVGPGKRIHFVQGDAIRHPFPPASFDFVAAVASLHHLPLTAAFECFAELLRPGGVLAVIGLYRLRTPSDFATAAIAVPTSLAMRCLYGHDQVRAPVREPRETLEEIRSACDAILPGAVLRRLLLFRYSLVWTKPA